MNQWWLDCRRIYASLGLNELKGLWERVLNTHFTWCWSQLWPKGQNVICIHNFQSISWIETILFQINFHWVCISMSDWCNVIYIQLVQIKSGYQLIVNPESETIMMIKTKKMPPKLHQKNEPIVLKSIHLTHWGWDKMAILLQTTFSSAFS